MGQRVLATADDKRLGSGEAIEQMDSPSIQVRREEEGCHYSGVLHLQRCSGVLRNADGYELGEWALGLLVNMEVLRWTNL